VDKDYKAEPGGQRPAVAEDIPTKTITLPADQWQAILDAVECHWDEVPPGEGRQSPPLSAASAALSVALAQPEPAAPTVMEIIAMADEIEEEGLGQVDLVRRALARWGGHTSQEVL
jgi:hypothetical protein